MCGIFGIISKRNISETLYHGMRRLQHRGQDAAGIFLYHSKKDQFAQYKSLGLVSHLFHHYPETLSEADWGIGHIRYATIGDGRIEDTQPQNLTVHQHTVAMAHNGNIVNYVPLRDKAENCGTPLASSCDVEILLRQFCDSLPDDQIHFNAICHAVKSIYSEVAGAYSVISLITGKGLIAFRDPQGIRPLLYGYNQAEQTYAFASESEPLLALGFETMESIEPGEVIFIDRCFNVHRRRLLIQKHNHCSFEFVYFGRANSSIEEREIYEIRSKLGIELGKRIKNAGIHADVVVAIPDTSRPAGLSLARELGIPFEEGLVKKDHIGRTFIMATQEAREQATDQKLVAVPCVFKDKRVLLVDDSIVRGTVSKRVIQMARQAGAAEVFFASTFPPIRHPCFYGIDFPNEDQLIAKQRDPQAIAQLLDADSVFFNDIAAVKHAIGMDDLCLACTDGNYPIQTSGIEELQALRQMHLAAQLA